MSIKKNMNDFSFDEYMNSPEMKEYQAKMEAKNKFVKTGSNVVHFEYLGSLISEEEFEDYEKRLLKNGLELSRFDKEGVMYASLDDFQITVYILLAQPIIQELLVGLSTNATWDVIKFMLRNSFEKLNGKEYKKCSPSKVDTKKVCFGLKVKLDKNTSFNFKLDGDLEESTIEKSLDKILIFLKEQKVNDTFKHTDMVYIDKKNGNWFKVDTEKELKKRISKIKKK
jgi:hypothetical protein